MSPICPQCRKPVTRVDDFWSCPRHGEVTPVEEGDGAASSPSPTAIIKPKVFISYGRRDARQLVDRLCDDLKEAGFDVWRDTREIRAGTDWQAEIVDGLRCAQVVVAVMTPHSVRTSKTAPDQIDSVCLGEIAYALFNPPPLPVVPAMAATCEPPLALFHLDYVDLRAWTDAEDQYRAGLARLIDGIGAALRGEKRLRSWHHQLQPIDFASFLHLKRRDFHGRRWLFDKIDAWRTASSSERALLVKGDPGVGKSAVVAELVHRNPDGQVLAYHCCQWDVGDTLSAGRFVRNLAAMVASKLEPYAALLEHDPAVRDALGEGRCETDPGSALVAGLLTPLERLPAPDGGPRYILIDALDEALLAPPGKSTIVDVLASKIEQLPGWLRIVATTRNDPSVLGKLGGLRAVQVDAQTDDNRTDVREFLDTALRQPNLAERLLQAGLEADSVRDTLVTCSEGNFLYVRQAIDAILRDQIDLVQIHRLPPGLAGMYEQRFARQFPEEACFAVPKRIFEVLSVAQEPLTEAELADATGLEPDEELAPALRKLESYLPRRLDAAGRERFTFFHKSLADWLTDSNRRGLRFAVAPNAVHKRLAEEGLRQHRLSSTTSYFLKALPWHLISTERWNDLEYLLTDLQYFETCNAAGQVEQLASNLKAAWRALPRTRICGKIIKLLHESLSREIHFIDRHRKDYPQALFQCFWNQAWWYDCPEAAQHYAAGSEPGKHAKLNLHRLLDRWRSEKEAARPHFAWLRTLRPPPIHLDTPQDAILRGHEAEVLSVACSPDGERIVSAARDRTVRLWNAVTGAELRTLCGHEDWVTSVAFFPNGARIVSGSYDNTVRLWDTQKGVELRTLRGHEGQVTSVAVSSDGAQVISGSSDNTVRLWDPLAGTQLQTLHGHGSGVTSVAFSRDLKWILSGAADNTVRIWDRRTGTQLRVLLGHKDAVRSIACSPDGVRIASGSADKTIRIWNAQTGAELQTLHGHESLVLSVAFSFDGTRLVSGSADNTVRLWDVKTGSELRILRGHEDWVKHVTFTLDAAQIVSGSDDKTVRLWDARSVSDLQSLHGHEDWLTSVAFSLDGTRIVSGSLDNTVRLWDSQTGTVTNTLRGHESRVRCVAFSPDGALVVSGSRDQTVRVWDARTGSELQTLRGHESDVTSVSFSPDSTKVVSASRDQIVRFWDAQTGKCLETTAGTGDVKPIAEDTSQFPYNALAREQQTDVESFSDSQTVASFPVSLRHIVTHPSRRIWAGINANHLYLLQLEGAVRQE